MSQSAIFQYMGLAYLGPILVVSTLKSSRCTALTLMQVNKLPPSFTQIIFLISSKDTFLEGDLE